MNYIDNQEPNNFQLETTTVWSFPDRGHWATHEGSYRGNWSPFVPRNLIFKYTKPGETILDCFVGGGTTLIEAKLLSRRSIGVDINPAAIKLCRHKLKFRSGKYDHEPQLRVGDARNLSFLDDNSTDLVCSHPPYANAISYSKDIEGDLSRLEVKKFIDEMSQVAKENYRVLRPGRCCAVLIGDRRQNKRVVPLGMMVMRVYLQAGFILKELIIKLQHNTTMEKAWQERARKHNFLLLAHEYLPVFEKPAGQEG